MLSTVESDIIFTNKYSQSKNTKVKIPISIIADIYSLPFLPLRFFVFGVIVATDIIFTCLLFILSHFLSPYKITLVVFTQMIFL